MNQKPRMDTDGEKQTGHQKAQKSTKKDRILNGELCDIRESRRDLQKASKGQGILATDGTRIKHRFGEKDEGEGYVAA